MPLGAGPHKVGSGVPSVVGRGGGRLHDPAPTYLHPACCNISMPDRPKPQQAVCFCAGKHMLRCKPQALALNCNCTRLSIIDFHGVLSFYDFRTPPLQAPGPQGGAVPTVGEHLAAERKVS